jgi:D-alanyl-D-alanine carboxypeptidase
MRHRRRLLCLLIILFVLLIFSRLRSQQQTCRGSLSATLAKAALLMDAAPAVLYEVNAHQQMPPASVTKIMNCPVVVERAGWLRR